MRKLNSLQATDKIDLEHTSRVCCAFPLWHSFRGEKLGPYDGGLPCTSCSSESCRDLSWQSLESHLYLIPLLGHHKPSWNNPYASWKTDESETFFSIIYLFIYLSLALLWIFFFKMLMIALVVMVVTDNGQL